MTSFSTAPQAMSSPGPQTLRWTTPDGRAMQARWHSEAGVPAPERLRVIDDTTPADAAFRLASEGTGLLWQGDYQNARHLLQALTRRLDRQAGPAPGGRHPSGDARAEAAAPPQAFHQHR